MTDISICSSPPPRRHPGGAFPARPHRGPLRLAACCPAPSLTFWRTVLYTINSDKLYNCRRPMTNVRISDDTHDTLRCLAALEGQTMQSVLDKAVEEYRRRRFWDDVDAASSGLRQDHAAWQEELAESRAWEATLADGLDSNARRQQQP